MTRQETQLCIDGFKQILKWYETDDRRVFFYTGDYFGICFLVFDLDHDETESIISTYLIKNLPPKRYEGFYWSTKSKTGRMNWLRKHIEKLESELEKL